MAKGGLHYMNLDVSKNFENNLQLIENWNDKEKSDIAKKIN